jgi:hypothetical protein
MGLSLIRMKSLKILVPFYKSGIKIAIHCYKTFLRLSIIAGLGNWSAEKKQKTTNKTTKNPIRNTGLIRRSAQ